MRSVYNLLKAEGPRVADHCVRVYDAHEHKMKAAR